MKTILLLITICLFTLPISAKKVKFSVDMTGQQVSPNGVHVMGDFQEAAGFAGGNWQPDTTPLSLEIGTMIYSRVVEIPGMTKIEFKYLNGDKSYEAEFVPDESRVGFDFNDNRWFLIDSLANDTTIISSVLFGGNAPAGLKLLRFKVNLQNQTAIDALGIHVAGNFQNWNAAQTKMYSFDGSIYEYIAYVSAGNFEYKFANGNSSGKYEIVPTNCANNSNRTIQISQDSVLPAVCFGECAPCAISDVHDFVLSQKNRLFPNPAKRLSTLEMSETGRKNIRIADNFGRIIQNFVDLDNSLLNIDCSEFAVGIYFLTIENFNLKSTVTLKMIITE